MQEVQTKSRRNVEIMLQSVQPNNNLQPFTGTRWLWYRLGMQCLVIWGDVDALHVLQTLCRGRSWGHSTLVSVRCSSS